MKRACAEVRFIDNDGLILPLDLGAVVAKAAVISQKGLSDRPRLLRGNFAPPAQRVVPDRPNAWRKCYARSGWHLIPYSCRRGTCRSVAILYGPVASLVGV